jgi:hypothetical protein
VKAALLRYGYGRWGKINEATHLLLKTEEDIQIYAEAWVQQNVAELGNIKRTTLRTLLYV